MISTMSSGMMTSTNGYCYNKFGTESNGTAISSSNGTGTSPPFSISPSATTQFAYEQCHQQHYSCMHGPMSITAQGALERNSANNMTECVAVPTSEHVAEIVGKQGCKIKSLRDKTNTYIKTPMRGEEPIFVITGRLEDVEIAKCEIVQAAEHFTQIRAQRRLQPPAVPGQVSEKMQVPLRLVGLIVGPKGQTIKRIQQDTNTYIVTPGREKVPIFDITGPKDGVDTARNMIAEHILSRTGNTLEELLRQQAEQGIMGARPRSRSADEAVVANFDIGCWNVDPEPESDGDGSDSGMVMGSNGMPYRINDGNGHACSHAPRFASFSAASSSTPYDVSSSATMMPQKQQQQYARPLNGMLSYQYNGSTNGYNSGSTNGIANGTGTLMSNNNRSFCLSSHPNSNGCGNGSVLTRPAHAPAEHMCSAMNCNNKMRSASFSAAGMGGGYVCGESSPEPQNHQQQLHRAAAAAAAVAGGRHSLQYSSMSEAFGGNNATLMSGTGSHATGFHPQQPQQNNNGSLFHTHNNFRRLNSESQQFSAFAALGEYASNNGDPTERQQPSSARRFSQPSTSGHYYCQPQSVQRGGYDQQQAMQATTPTNLTSSVTSAANSINSFSTGFWSAAPTTASSSAKTENGGGLFVMPDMDKMLSTLTLNDGGADAFANNGSGKATSTSASSSSTSSCGNNNFWSGNGNIDNGGGLASSTSKLCMF